MELRFEAERELQGTSLLFKVIFTLCRYVSEVKVLVTSDGRLGTFDLHDMPLGSGDWRRVFLYFVILELTESVSELVAHLLY